MIVLDLEINKIHLQTTPSFNSTFFDKLLPRNQKFNKLEVQLEAHMSLYCSPGKEYFIAYRSIY